MHEQTLQITGPPDLLQAVPYLLGFHPADSFVALGLTAGRLVVTARMDLSDLAEPELLGRLVAALARGGATELVGVVYDSDPPAPTGSPLPWSGLVPELADECERHGCELGELLRVAGGRWWSYRCGSVRCCPAEGTEIPGLPSAFVAEATFAGMVALPDRDSLAATLDPVAPERLAAVERLLAVESRRAADELGAGELGAGAHERAVRSVKRAIFAAARRADAEICLEVSDTEVARFGSALTQITLRDAVWLAIDDGRLDGRPLWRELARRLPGRSAAAPLFLLGWASWRAGNGALAAIAAERAVQHDAGYSAADLLLAALAHGLAPRQVPRMRLRRGQAA